MVSDVDERETCQEILNNMKLSESSLNLARDIEVTEPKSPEDIYKAHLIDGSACAGASVDSSRKSLAATFVNAFVNTGFGQDKLMIVPSDAFSGGTIGGWMYKNNDHGKVVQQQVWMVHTSQRTIFGLELQKLSRTGCGGERFLLGNGTEWIQH